MASRILASLFRQRAVRAALLFALCIGWTGGMAAATHRLELPNGEILIGALVAEEDGVVVFRSETLGELRVPKEGTRLLPLAGTTAEPSANAPAWVAATSAPEPVPSPETPAVSKPSAKWRRVLEAGYSYQTRGSLVSSTSTYLRGEVSREHENGKTLVEGRYIFGKQDDQRNTDKLELAFRAREKFLARIALRSDLSYGYDYLKQISHQFEEDLGLSFEVSAHPRLRYAIGPGVAVQYSEPALGQYGFKVLGSLAHELTIKFGERISLSHTASYLFVASELTNYRLRANTVLTGLITDRVSANLRYEYEFESIRPVASGRSDHRIFTTLGYVY